MPKIDDVFLKEGIKFKKLIRQTDRFALIKGSWRGKTIAFKILVDPKRRYAKNALMREAKVLEILNKFPQVKSPKLLGLNLKIKYPYFFEEFIDGDVLEKKSGLFFRDLEKNSITQIAEILNNLIKIPLFKFKNIKNKTSFSTSYFQESFNFHKKTINSELTISQKNKLKQLIKIKPKKLFPVHGEVYPNNLIKNKFGEIYLLDWENFGFGSLARDVASVYLRIKNEASKEFFIKEIKFKNQKDFKNLFALELALQSIGSLSYLKSDRDYFLKQVKKVL